jgi:hypothetical protein
MRAFAFFGELRVAKPGWALSIECGTYRYRYEFHAAAIRMHI